MNKNSRRTRRNPDGLAMEGGRTFVASAFGVAGAVALEAGVNSLKKGGTGADKDNAKLSNNATAAVVGGVGTAIGLALHARDMAPRVGKALIAASVALAGARVIGHRGDTEAQRAGRLAGSRGPTGQDGRLRFEFPQIEIDPALEGTVVTINGSRFGSAYGARIQRSGRALLIFGLPNGTYKIEVSYGGRVTDRARVTVSEGSIYRLQSTMAQNQSQTRYQPEWLEYEQKGQDGTGYRIFDRRAPNAKFSPDFIAGSVKSLSPSGYHCEEREPTIQDSPMAESIQPEPRTLAVPESVYARPVPRPRLDIAKFVLPRQ